MIQDMNVFRNTFRLIALMGFAVCGLNVAVLSATVDDKPAVPSRTVSIAAVGDMMIGNWGDVIIKKTSLDHLFALTAPILREADIATGNLEGPHCISGKIPLDKKFVFKMPPEQLDGYREAGFDMLNLANNHAMDFGSECLLESIAEITDRGMAYCGAGRDIQDANIPRVIRRNGIRVAFLGYSATFPEEAWATGDKPGTMFPYRQRVIKAVKLASAENDLVVVHFHWGSELRPDPKQYQRDLAHLVIDHGADLVIGHHPHILQGIEMYRNRLIFYSLGNFTFASYSRRAGSSIIARVTLDADGSLVSADVVPLHVLNIDVDLQPVPLPGDVVVLEELRQLAGLIGDGIPVVPDEDGVITEVFRQKNLLEEERVELRSDDRYPTKEGTGDLIDGCR